jgi:hypothetical protein
MDALFILYLSLSIFHHTPHGCFSASVVLHPRRQSLAGFVTSVVLRPGRQSLAGLVTLYMCTPEMVPYFDPRTRMETSGGESSPEIFHP